MRLRNSILLKTIFALKGNFADGHSPSRKVLSGIEVAPYKNGAKAAVCISGDFELSWAWRGRGQEVMNSRGISERRNMPLLLRLLDEYTMPITWATVGHMFLESCQRSTSGVPHAKMPRPPVNDRWIGDWYMHDPCSDFIREPLWYAPDLIQQITESKTSHELGTHSFSHINFSRRCSTPELVKAELEACGEAMESFGNRPRSLVFPHNVMGYSHLPLLAGLGIVAVRHRDKKIMLSYPERTPTGVYKFYESMQVRIAERYDYFPKAKLFIDEAMKRHAAYCLWFHPSDAIETFDTVFRLILQYIDNERKKGHLWVATMRDLAAYCEARDQLQLEVSRTDTKLTIILRSALDTSRYGAPEVTLLIPIAARPKSGRLKTSDGQQTPVQWMASDGGGASVLMVNVPATAKLLQFEF
jgi:peptidoglycan/xylan/chitin deacetylase (PgdA/CDA1 family)